MEYARQNKKRKTRLSLFIKLGLMASFAFQAPQILKAKESETDNYEHSERHYMSACEYGDRAVGTVDLSLSQEHELPLREVLNLGPECSGKQIKSIRVLAQGESPGAMTSLEVDHRIQNSASLSHEQDWREFSLNPNENTLDSEIYDLSLTFQGSAKVGLVEAVFANSYNHNAFAPLVANRFRRVSYRDYRGFTVRSRVPRRFRHQIGRGYIPLRKILNLDQAYRSYRIQYVTVTARTAAGRGRANLVVNNEQYYRGERFSRRWDTHYFYPRERRNRIGRDIRILGVETIGRFEVAGVSARILYPRGHGRYYRPGRPYYRRGNHHHRRGHWHQRRGHVRRDHYRRGRHNNRRVSRPNHSNNRRPDRRFRRSPGHEERARRRDRARRDDLRARRSPARGDSVRRNRGRSATRGRANARSARGAKSGRDRRRASRGRTSRGGGSS